MRGHSSLTIFLTLTLVVCLAPRARPDDAFDFFPSADVRYKKIRVREVRSTDTIVLENDLKVRLIGLKALPLPEQAEAERDEHGFVIKEDRPYATLEERALRFAKQLLEGKLVRLEFDVRRKDDGLKTLAYVFLIDDDRMANEMIIQNGYASLHIQPPNMKYAERFRAAYRAAREERRGIHAEF